MPSVNGTNASEFLIDPWASDSTINRLNANWSEGQDTMIGGLHDDIFHVNSAGDRVIELGVSSYDTVVSRAQSYTLTNRVEALTLDNTPADGDGGSEPPSALNGTGNALDNLILGNDRDNRLSGEDGDDHLRGGHGRDTLLGGRGDDYLDGGTGNDSLSGGAGNDYLLGGEGNDTLGGGAGDDTLLGGTGDDVMRGHAGNDVYYVDSVGDRVHEALNQGVDTVYSWVNTTLSAHVENLEMVNVAGAVQGRGNAQANVINGNDFDNIIHGLGGDDQLKGGLGDDTLLGGDGNDLMQGNGGRDALNGGAGDDVLWGGAGADGLYGDQGDDTLQGGDGDDALNGGEGGDSLFGGAGNDILNGGFDTDFDALLGGAGDDTYIVQTSADSVVEVADEGTDKVFSGISTTLGDHVEHLQLFSVEEALNGTGNTLDNELGGNVYDNVLSGLAGNDTLSGNAGHDVLTGGDGMDHFVFQHGGGDNADAITDFNPEDDSIVLSSLWLNHAATGEAGTGGLTGLSFVGGNAVGNALAAESFFAGAGQTGAGAGSLGGVYLNTLDGHFYYNATAGGDSLLLGSVSLAAASTMEASDFLLGA